GDLIERRIARALQIAAVSRPLAVLGRECRCLPGHRHRRPQHQQAEGDDPDRPAPANSLHLRLLGSIQSNGGKTGVIVSTRTGLREESVLTALSIPRGSRVTSKIAPNSGGGRQIPVGPRMFLPCLLARVSKTPRDRRTRLNF